MYFKIFNDIELVFVHLSGVLSQHEIVSVNTTIFTNPEFSPHYSGFVDARDVKLKLTTTQMHNMQKEISEIAPVKGRWTHLSDDPRYIALTMEYIEASAHLHPCRIVYSLKEAQDFLGIQNMSYYLKLPAKP